MSFRSSGRFPQILAACAWFTFLATSSALTYHIGYIFDEANNPGKRAQVAAVMDVAMAVYNSTTQINVDINVSWHPGIPTAQSDYNGTLGFGGSISEQVAIHETAHYLGSGTYGSWAGNFDGGGVWVGPALRRYIKLFDGPGAEIRQSGVHYYPYGFNYGNEDSPQARRRIGRLIEAMRQDMGITDGDGNGISDEWERQKIGFAGQPAAGDADGDGISNFDEYWTDSQPLWPCPVKSGHVYQLRSRLSQKLLEADGTTAGSNVRQNPNSGSSLQKWLATYVSGGYWKFTNFTSGKAMEVAGFSTDPSGNIIAWDDTGGTNQQWRIFPSASGAAYWKLGNRNSTNMVVDVDGGTGAVGDNANIAQYFDDQNAFNQDWAFDDVTAGVASDGLVANYKMEGNARDFGGRNFHGTASGGVTYTTGRVDGLAATFNGSNGSIRVPATVERNFTVACWVKTTATAGGPQWYNGMGLIDAEVPGVAKDFGLAMVGGKAAFGVGQNDLTITSAATINDGAWHHVAATLDTGNGAMRLYVDGLLSASGTGPTSARTAPSTFTLGSIAGANGFLNGSLDEARLYNKILAVDEIARLAQTGSSMVAGYGFEGTARDVTRFNNHGDAMDATFTTGKIGAQAVQLNGTSSFVKLPAAVTSDFTVAFWLKTTAVGGTGQWYAGKPIVDADVPGVANDWGISVGGNHVAFGTGNTGAGTTIESATNINDGTWHHVLATRTNATGAMKLFVDGALQATGTGSTALRDAPGGIRVGSTLFGGAFFTGAVDDLKIFNYALSSTQAASLAAPLPALWTATDIGLPASDGYSGYNAASAAFTVTGGGVAGTADQLQLVSSTATGDQILVTRVDFFPTNTASATTGITFRGSTAADSAFAELAYDRAQQALRFRQRDATGSAVLQTGASVSISGQFWLRLVRVGNTFAAAYSTTAGTPGAGEWTVVGNHVTPLPTTALAGLRVSSGVADTLATAGFSSVSIVVPTPGQAWRQKYFADIANLNNAQDLADPDRDGLPNVIERAFGLDPTLPDAIAARPQAANDGTYLSLTYQRSLAASDLALQLEWSNDLGTWYETGTTDTLISSGGGVEIRTARVPISLLDPTRAFLRLRVR